MKKNIKLTLFIYTLTWLATMLMLAIFMFREGFSWNQFVEQCYDLFSNPSFLVVLHLLFIGVFGVVLLTKYFIRLFRQKGWRVGFKQFVFRLLLPISVLIFGVRAVHYNNSFETLDFTWDYEVENTSGHTKNLYAKDGKHRGMSVFSRRDDYQKAIDVLIKDNIEWVAVIPFMYQETERTNALVLRREEGKWSRRDSSFANRINILHNRGLHVQLKPHIWMRDGWRSNITLSEEDWNTWFTSYRKHMLHYAGMAEQLGVGLFCVGTELRTAIQHKPEAWMTLINDIKKIYKGKLTYAANWDDPIEAIPFWKQMDYIGIQAYFPLTQEKYPELEAIKEGWDEHIPKLKEASKTYKRPILFTEIGYRSDNEATIKPWEWGSRFGTLSKKKSDETQRRAYEALFQKLWDKPWFAGCYFWQWHTTSTPERMKTNVDFTPRFKPAENTLTQWYGTLGKKTKS